MTTMQVVNGQVVIKLRYYTPPNKLRDKTEVADGSVIVESWFKTAFLEERLNCSQFPLIGEGTLL